MSDRVSQTDDLQRCQAIVALLKRPAAYVERPSRVECIETHISFVFLTDRHAYKLKKPVRFDFLDFSTAPLRRAACDEEMRLNRRLAPHVYLEVVPVTCQGRQLQLGGSGRPVDWVVKMRRLPADRSLDRLIQSGDLTDGHIRQIGRLLAHFYQQLPPVALRIDEYRREIEAHVEGNRRELTDARHGLDGLTARRVHEAQLRFLRLDVDLLDDRVRDGRIVDGHGDLRPEHIYFAPQPTVIDCIEFNAEFRQLDVADELSFLTMECAALDAEAVGDEIAAHYRAESNDDAPPKLLAFYRCYRACVRAKVWALRGEQLSGESRRTAMARAAGYLRLADSCCSQLGPPLLLVVRGLTGTGKSTLATALADALGIELLQTDAIRRELFGRSLRPAAYGEANYRPQNRQSVYDEMFRRAESLLGRGLSVVLDGTFLAADTRSQAVALADRYGSSPVIVRCECPETVAVQRIQSRLSAGRSASESRPETFVQQQRAEERDMPGTPSIAVDSEQALPAMLADVLGELRSRLGCGIAHSASMHQ